MKDHLNVSSALTANPLSQPAPALENRPHRLPGIIQEETAPGDRFDGRFHGIDPGNWDNSAIEEMDLDAALEFSAFIRMQAQSSGGRRMMGLAHHPITPQQVGQLLGQ